MSALIPKDIESFLYEVGTYEGSAPGAFQEYARTLAALLWDKYVIVKDASIQILPSSMSYSHCSGSNRQSTDQRKDGSFQSHMMADLFGKWVKLVRELDGKSIEDAARLAKIASKDWSAIEEGHIPAPPALQCVAIGLGRTLSEIAPMVLLCFDAWK